MVAIISNEWLRKKLGITRVRTDSTDSGIEEYGSTTVEFIDNNWNWTATFNRWEKEESFYFDKNNRGVRRLYQRYSDKYAKWQRSAFYEWLISLYLNNLWENKRYYRSIIYQKLTVLFLSLLNSKKEAHLFRRKTKRSTILKKRYRQRRIK